MVGAAVGIAFPAEEAWEPHLVKVKEHRTAKSRHTVEIFFIINLQSYKFVLELVPK
jgi:hypothetical protein